MLTHFIRLQWKSFFRSASFSSKLVIKIFMGFFALYFAVSFAILGGSIYFILEEELGLEPFETVNKFMVYFLAMDLFARYVLQKMPVVNIKPLLYLPFNKSKIVHFSLWKTILSFFNIVHAFFFIPFAIVLLIKDFDVLGVIAWFVAMTALIFCNNFINVFVNAINRIFYVVLGLLILMGVLQYYGVFDITLWTGPVFESFYEMPVLSLLPVLLLIAFYQIAFRYFKSRLYLDSGLAVKQKAASTEQLDWVNRFGSIAVFLKNDIKLIKRNKRSRTTVIMSFLFVFYGLLFFSGSISMYDGPFWRMFAALFVTGGFLFSFGQFVPSWDSAYYPLMMSQNIRYRDYLNSKYWLMVMATLICMVLATFYLYFGWEVYLAVVAGAFYNIGVNCYMVLWGGAYVKTPIDLTSNKKAFGDSQAFNAKTLLMTVPKLLVPMLLYGLGYYTLGPIYGYVLVLLVAVIGFAFKEKVFNIIEKIYKAEKYKTLAAYKQNN